MIEAKNSTTGILKQKSALRPKLLISIFILVALIALGRWFAFALLRSVPQQSVVMAIYPEGSLNAALVKNYQQILIRKGVDLKLVPSAGAAESVDRLRDSKSGISIALIPGGITTEQESPQLVSLGTLFYQPLWVFSRRQLRKEHEELLHGNNKLRGLRISIGPEGSSSRVISLKLLQRAGAVDKGPATFLSCTPSESAQKLIRGEIDVAIFLDGWESPAVQKLLKAKDIDLENIPRADAFVALFPFLSKLVLPAGVVDMAGPWPPADVQLIAPKSSLVVRNDLHPAIQYMLLEAAMEIHSTPGMFRSAGRFPAAEPVDLPLSPYAVEFYKTGTPFLLRYLPFKLAVLLEQPVVWLIPVFVILFPVFRLAPAIYDWFERRRVYSLYADLRHLEEEILFAAPGQNRKVFIERLNQLKDRACNLSLPSSFKPLAYSLRLHIDMVREEAEKAAIKEES